jgi:hypothetical protein
MRIATKFAPGMGAVVIGLLAVTQASCGTTPPDPGEFITTHLAQVDGVVLNSLRVPQESVTVTGRTLRLDAAYEFRVGTTDRNGRFSFQVGRIDGSDRPSPDTLSVMMSVYAHGSKYPRAPDGRQLTDSLPIVIRFAKVGQPVPIITVEAIFRGL